MKYLITGNLGYIGPVLCKFIKNIDPNSFIVGYDIGYFLNCEVASELEQEPPNLDIQIFGDVRDHFKLEKYIKDSDFVIHLAAISNDPMGAEFEKVTKTINQDSSLFIAKKAIEHGCKAFVFASSCSVYGAGSDKPRTENDEVNPLTAYAKSKINTELNLGEIVNNNNTMISCLRFATACGFSPNLRLDLVLNDFVATALSTKSIKILSNGSPWRPLIDVEDMSRAIYWSCHRKTGKNFEILNVGASACNYKIIDLANAVKNIFKDEMKVDIKVEVNLNAEPDKRSYKVNFDKFYSLAEQNFLPRVSLSESIKRLIYGTKPFSLRLLNENRDYLIRLKVLKSLKNSNLLDDNLYWK